MWQAIRTFFGSPIGKIGGAALKLWHVAAAVTIVAAGAAEGGYAYNHYFAPAATPQHVVVFISGINAGTKGCFNDTFSEPLLIPLEQQVGIANPYAAGCDNTGANFASSPTSMVLYSYVGGHMDTAHGVWIPNDYDACNVNDLTLQSDVQGLDHLLDQYRQVYPSATFTLVGHSLGGLVALQGAYDYTVALRHAGIVNKVVTLDAPLGGIQTSYWGQIGSGILTWLQQQTCVGPLGTVIDSDIPTLGDATATAAQVGLATACANPAVEPQVVLSACAARALVQAGVGVVTLGNQQDGLYCNPALAAARTTICASQNLSTQAPVLGHLDNLTPLTDDTGFFAGHGTILNDPKANNEVMRAILAPVVTIAQPVSGSIVSATSTGVAITYAATVHCLWGRAQHATAFVAAAGSQSDLFAGTASRSSDSSTLNLNGMVSLPSSLSAAAMRFYVDASGSACAYPSGAKFQPTKNDYYGGAAVPVAFNVAQGGSASTAPTQPADPSDAAFMLAASPVVTADAGDTFTAYFDELNAGNTTWSDAGGYQLVCDASAPGNNCMGGQPTGLNGAQVAPGQQATVYVSFTAPGTAGTYKTAWMIGANGKGFGSGTISVSVKVNAAPMAYIGDSNGTLHAFDASSGHERWHFPTGGNSAQALAVANGIVYVGEIDGVDVTYVTSRVYAVNVATGAPLWHVDGVSTTFGDLGTGNVLTFEALDNGLLYLELGNSITAVDAQTGHQKWQYSVGSDTISAFALSGTAFYITHDNQGANPRLDAVSTSSGAQIWSKAPMSPVDPEGIAVDAGNIYIAETDLPASGPNESYGRVEAFHSDTGNRLWQVGSFDISTFVQASGGRVYVDIPTGDEGRGFAVWNGQTHTALWASPLGCQIENAHPTLDAVFDACTDYSPTLDQIIADLDPATGHVRWQRPLPLGGSADIGISLNAGIVYAWTGDTNALDANSGSILWHHAGSFGAAGYGFAAVAANDGTATVLDAHNGSVKWSFPAGQQNWPPFVFIAAP